MDRRAFLAAVGGLAGCSGLGTESTPTVTPAPVETPASSTPRSVGTRRFADIDCPSFLSSSLRRVCSHRLPPDPILALEPTPVVTAVTQQRRLTDPVWFTLRTRLTDGVSVFATAWGLHRYDDSGWSLVETGTGEGSGTTVSEANDYYWVLHSGEENRDGPDVTATQVRLVPGIYAFAVTAITERSRMGVECIALFEVTGPD